MIAQFRNLYPSGCLISELLAIDHGQFIVRVLVQVEGMTRATGLAAAETVELAEDQARQRALEILGPEMKISVPKTSIQAEETALSQPTETVLTTDQPDLTKSATGENSLQPLPSQDWLSATYLNPEQGKQKPKLAQIESVDSLSKSRSASLPLLPQDNPEIAPEVQPLQEEQPTSPTAKSTNLRSMDSQDYSSDIAKTQIELTRLGWTNEQGTAHLQKTYGKRSRRLLTEEELLDFLHYLESLPSPLGEA